MLSQVAVRCAFIEKKEIMSLAVKLKEQLNGKREKI